MKYKQDLGCESDIKEYKQFCLCINHLMVYGDNLIEFYRTCYWDFNHIVLYTIKKYFKLYLKYDCFCGWWDRQEQTYRYKVFFRSCKSRASGIWVKTTNSNKPSENQNLVKLQRVNARMTWLGEAMKDGVSTDMPRGAANWLWSGEFRMGQPAAGYTAVSSRWIQ